VVAGARQARRGGARALRRAPAGQARSLSLFPGEPAFGPWRPADLKDLLDGSVRSVAVDGRSGAGKTTLAHALAATVLRSAVVHTDDIARAELADLVDRAIWVQSDREVARERGIERDGGDAAGWDEWQSEEVPFLERDRPWERAEVIVAGTGLAPAGELLVAASVA
jgi:hypothetical protein